MHKASLPEPLMRNMNCCSKIMSGSSHGNGSDLKINSDPADKVSILTRSQHDGTVAGLGHDEKPTESSAPTSIAIKDVRLEEKHFGNMSDDIDSAEVVPPELGRSASDTESMTVEYIYPKGGLQAWLVVFGSWCALFASLGIANTLASFQAYISQDQLSSYSPSQTGWIFSLYIFLTFGCGIYIGPIFDVYGPRFLVLPGSVCVVLSMFLLGVCKG